MSIIARGGVTYAQTTVQIPLELRDKARELGVGLSSTLVFALKKKIEEPAGSEQ